MDEYQALAVAAVEALQAANQPKWTEVAAVIVSIMQCVLIIWGLVLMSRAGQRRDRQIDVITEGLREQSAGIRALLERTA